MLSNFYSYWTCRSVDTWERICYPLKKWLRNQQHPAGRRGKIDDQLKIITRLIDVIINHQAPQTMESEFEFEWKKKRVYWVIYHNLDTIIVSESVQVPLKLNIATLIYLVSPKSGTWKKKISEWFSKKCHMQEFCTWNTFTYIRYLEVKCTRGQERQNW